MHMLERILTKTVNAGIVGTFPATVGAVEQERRYVEELDRQEEAFRQMQERTRRRLMLHISCE